MPALPFFSFVAPANTSTSTNPATPLTTGVQQGSQAHINIESLDSTLDYSENPLGFWQQLQTANANYSLPEGQELAAFSGPLMSSGDLSQLDPSLEENNETPVQINGMYLGQLDLEETHVSIPAFQHIENLRNAQPQLHQGQITKASQGQLANNAISGMTGATLQPGIPTNDNVLAANIAANQTKTAPLTPTQTPIMPLTEQAASASQSGAALKQGGIKLTESDLAKLSEGELSDDVNLESLSSAEGKSLHEKPLTLQTTKEAIGTQQVSSTNLESLAQTDSKLLSGDALQSLGKDGQLTNRSMALDSSVQTQTQNADKLPTPMQKLDVPPNHPQWNDQVAKRVMIMANESMQTARIQLDPPELGALEVKIKVQHDQVSVSFGSNHQVVRDALEAQSPRLRELLEQQGINLTDVDVSEHSNQQSNQQDQEEFVQEGTLDESGNPVSDQASSSVVMESDSLVDYFA